MFCCFLFLKSNNFLDTQKVIRVYREQSEVSLNQSLNFEFQGGNGFSDAEIHEDLYEQESTVRRRSTKGKLIVRGGWLMSSCK